MENQNPKPEEQSQKPKQGLSAPNLTELLTNKWIVTTRISSMLGQEAILLIEQTLLEYEVCLKNMAYFALTADEAGFAKMRTDLYSLKENRETLLINSFKYELGLRLGSVKKNAEIVEDLNEGGQLQGTTKEVVQPKKKKK